MDAALRISRLMASRSGKCFFFCLSVSREPLNFCDLGFKAGESLGLLEWCELKRPSQALV